MPWQPPRLVRVPLVRMRAGALGVLASTANAALVCVRALNVGVHHVQICIMLSMCLSTTGWREGSVAGQC